MMCSPRYAHLVRQRAQAIGDGGIGFHISACRELGDGGDAGAGEFRHIALAHERVPFLLGKGERDADEGGGASHESRRRGAQSHARHIGPPDERQRRNNQCERDEDFGIKLRLHRQQKADRVGVDDHHIEEIRRHPDDLVFEP
jgi:hypothetical protein